MPLLPKLPPRSHKHTEERLKLAASGLQNVGLTIFAADIIAPAFNHSPKMAFWLRIVAFIPAALSMGAASILLRYIPVATSSEGPKS